MESDQETDPKELIDRVKASTGLELKDIADKLGIALRTLEKIRYRDVPLTVRNRRQLLEIERSYEKGGPILGDHEEVKFSVQKRDTTPQGKLRAAMQAEGINAAQLAKRIGYDAGPIQAVLERGSRISESMASRIAKALPGLTVEELLAGSDTPRVLDESGTTGTFGARHDVVLPPGVRARMVPLLSWTQAGSMSDYSDEAWEGEGVLALNAPVGKSFGLRVKGDSMVPEIREGDVVIVTADRAPRTGQIVIVRTVAGDVMCKLYNPKDGGRRVLLTSYNHAVHAPIELQQEEIKWIYPVLSVIRTY